MIAGNVPRHREARAQALLENHRSSPTAIASSLGVSDDLHMPRLTPILTSKALCISHACMPLSPCVKCTPGMCVYVRIQAVCGFEG